MGKKDVVRYDNELNQVSFRQWSGLEQDLFFAVLSKMQGRSTDTVAFSTDELRDFIDFAGKSGRRWEEVLTSAASKVMSKMYYIERTERKIRVMALFQMFELDLVKQTLTVQVSMNYEYIINKLQANFTQFELEEFANLRSTYAKSLYRLLKQWRTVGRREFTVEEFRAYMGVPKSYTVKKITQKVIEPIKQEMPTYFKDFTVETVRSRRRGRPITGYVFTWKPEPKPTEPWQEGKFDGMKRPESETAKARRRAVEAAERAEERQAKAAEQIEAERRRRENLESLAEKRKQHGGSMFAGKTGYVGDRGTKTGRQDAPLFLAPHRDDE